MRYVAYFSTPSVKRITFPESEIPELRTQSRIITTRVSDDFRRFWRDDLVRAPWGDIYRVTDKKIISRVEDHPYYKDLTRRQIGYLKKHDKIAVLTLAKEK